MKTNKGFLELSESPMDELSVVYGKIADSFEDLFESCGVWKPEHEEHYLFLQNTVFFLDDTLRKLEKKDIPSFINILKLGIIGSRFAKEGYRQNTADWNRHDQIIKETEDIFTKLNLPSQ